MVYVTKILRPPLPQNLWKYVCFRLRLCHTSYDLNKHVVGHLEHQEWTYNDVMILNVNDFEEFEIELDEDRNLRQIRPLQVAL